jgi:hypothetical protein
VSCTSARELHEQMNSCSCLMLILACVIYWQAKEITLLAEPQHLAVGRGWDVRA